MNTGPISILEHSSLLMLFNGQPLQNTCSSIFSLQRGNDEPIVLRLQPLSLGFHQSLRTRGIVPPLPPVKIARDSSGKPLRDAQGMVLSLSDQRDPDFLSAIEHYHQRVAVLSVAEGLRGDPGVRMETPRPETNIAADWQEYADRLFQEMEQAGFVAGDLVRLCKEICRLSNLIEDHLQAARRNFSPCPAANPD